MKRFVKFGMYAFLGVALATSFVGCSDDDPDYSNVTPPTVEVSHSISGRVTSMDGNGLPSATVSMDGTSVQTDENGMFVFDGVSAGTHTLTASASGKQTKETTVTVSSNGSNVVWNVSLPNEGTTVEISANGNTETSVTSETIEGNEEGEVTVDVTVPESALPQGSSIVITPLYTLDEAETRTGTRATTRAAETLMLIGTNVACTDANATLAEPISLIYDIDAEVAQSIRAQKFVNGQWVDAEYTVDGNHVTVFADQFTSYTLLFGADVTSSTTTTPLAFEQDLWDNLYGSGDMTVGSASFTYHVGTEITSSGTSRITAYLIEILARIAGANVTTATGSYPINVTLPIGTALHVTGEQQVTTLTVSALNRSVSGRQYGDVAIVTTTYNREHNGGGGGVH